MKRGLHLTPIIGILCLLCLSTTSSETLTPPIITSQALQNVFYIHLNANGSSIPFQLACEASGSHPIRYTWLKNGKEFPWFTHQPRIIQRADQGTLIFRSPHALDAGSYQCTAANKAGVAITNIVHVKYPTMGYFPPDDRPFALIVSEHDELSLPCHAAPDGDPKPQISWVLENKTSGVLRTLEQNERYSIDNEGRLHFASVLADDVLPNTFYVCRVSNIAGTRFGSRIMLTVLPLDPVFGKEVLRPLSKHFVSPERISAQFGKPLVLSCIYGGSPIPVVTWTKKGTSSRFFRSQDVISHLQTLKIPTVMWRDEGVYQCNISNGIGESKAHSFIVNVGVSPKFLINRIHNINTTIGSNILLSCPVFGIPSPEVEWLVNGTSLKKSLFHHRYAINYTELLINNVQLPDSGTYQCNASNLHGSEVTNLYLTVSEPSLSARALTMRKYEMIEGQSQRIDCHITLPEVDQVRWFRGNSLVSDDNIEILPNGTLYIHNISQSNEGIYHCKGLSKRMNAEIRFDAGNLVVMRPTSFSVIPQDTETCIGCTVIFHCQVRKDPTLNVTIEWLHNGATVNGQLNRGFFQYNNNSLLIQNIKKFHTGTYTCIARTELDVISESAVLFVRDLPLAPEIVGVKCRQQDGLIEWHALSDLRSPVTEFRLQSITEINNAEGWMDLKNVTAPETKAEVKLNPGQKYRFRMFAINSMGTSKPSEPSHMCETFPDVPYRHPPGVSGISGNVPREMIISWKPLPPIDHNGPGFFYRVHWRPAEENALWNAVDIMDWKQSTVPVGIHRTSFHHYIVKVEARNAIGRANILADEIDVVAGEEVPLAAPTQLTSLKVLNSTTAVIYWKPVLLESVRGVFKGYKLETWTAEEGYRNRKVIVVPGNHTVVILKVLQPSFQNNLRVWAFNGAYDGPPSSTLSLNTLQPL